MLVARFPWSLLAVAAALWCIGLMAIARADELGLAAENLLARQAVWSAVALGAMLLAAVSSRRVVFRWSYAAFGLSIVLLAAVYFFPTINGAHRWIRLGPVGFQPSDFARLAIVLAIARWLTHHDGRQRPSDLLVPLAMTLAPALLILKEPDLGTALILLPVLLAMLFVAGVRRRDLALLVVAGALVAPLLWTQMSREQRSRITAMAEQNRPDERPTRDGFHLDRAKRMLALGGVSGSFFQGDAVEDRTAYYVPEAATDSVATIVGERFGLVGMAGLLALYVALAWRGLVIAAESREAFGRLVAVGVVSLVAVPAAINTAMMVGLVPITGISLPLVSYGGSGLVTHGAALGLLVNIAVRPE